MKCAYCGAELMEGSLYCNNCGKAVQIVPDYNEFDDYLDNLVGTSNTTKLSDVKPVVKKKTLQDVEREKEQKRIKEKKMQQKKIIIISSIVFVIALIIIIFAIVNAVSSNNSQSFDYQVEKADEAVSDKDYKSAIEHYKKALEINSDSIDVRFSLAKIYMQQNNVDAAMILYQEIVKLDNCNKDAYKALISIYESKEDYDSIIELAKSVKNVKDTSIIKLFDDYIVNVPVSSEKEGSFDDKIDIKFEASDDCVIYYSFDNDDPMTKGEEYKAPIVLDAEGDYTINAVSKNSKGIYSDVVTYKYTLKFDIPQITSVSPDGGTFTNPGKIVIEVPEGCTVYYTWDSSDPNIYSEKYSEPIDIPEGNNILSIIAINNTSGKCSDIYRTRYEYYAQ